MARSLTLSGNQFHIVSRHYFPADPQLPSSHRVSSPSGQCQIILLADRGILTLITRLQLLYSAQGVDPLISWCPTTCTTMTLYTELESIFCIHSDFMPMTTTKFLKHCTQMCTRCQLPADNCLDVWLWYSTQLSVTLQMFFQGDDRPQGIFLWTEANLAEQVRLVWLYFLSTNSYLKNNNVLPASTIVWHQHYYMYYYNTLYHT